MLKYLLLTIIALLGFFVGVVWQDIPYFTLEKSIGLMDVLTFLMIGVFGFWFQRYMLKNNRKHDVSMTIMRDAVEDCFQCVDSILNIIESNISKELDDSSKKMIHQKLKDLSFHMDFIDEFLGRSEPASEYVDYKDSIVNDDFSMSEFIIDHVYFREISNSSNLIRKSLRQIVYGKIIS